MTSRVDLIRVSKVSDGKVRCLMCEDKVRRGVPYEAHGTPNKKNQVEYWVNVCLGCVADLFQPKSKKR